MTIASRSTRRTGTGRPWSPSVRALNSWYRWREDRAFGDRLARVEIPPPLFVLGHWRSGTTLLHNLLALDDQFAFPNLYEVFFPHTFLITEDDRTALVKPLIPRTRVMDNVPQRLDMPNEDEFATAAASLCSPYMMWAFPRAGNRYEKYLTFRDVPREEVERWKSALLLFMKKLTLRYERPLLLKSPPHTGRIKLLLELFPNARFVHVHRHPFEVFQSTHHLNGVLTQSLQFQKAKAEDLDDAVLRRYRAMHDAYFAERSLIPEGRFTRSLLPTSNASRSGRFKPSTRRSIFRDSKGRAQPLRSRGESGPVSQERVPPTRRGGEVQGARFVATVVQGMGLPS